MTEDTLTGKEGSSQATSLSFCIFTSEPMIGMIAYAGPIEYAIYQSCFARLSERPQLGGSDLFRLKLIRRRWNIQHCACSRYCLLGGKPRAGYFRGSGWRICAYDC